MIDVALVAMIVASIAGLGTLLWVARPRRRRPRAAHIESKRSRS